MGSLTVAQIAALCRAGFHGDGKLLITGANTLEEAGEQELAFVAGGKAVALASNSLAGCLIVKHDFNREGPWALIRVDEPRSSFAGVLSVLYAKPDRRAFRHPSAIIDETASIGPDTHIGALAVIGKSCKIGANCYIASGCVIGDGVTIGGGCTLHANVTLYDNVQIGERAVIHSGCVIGADGFGFARVGDVYQKFPQVGVVIIGDDVELGANSCVDRAALGQTTIGNGSKLDNLIHIAHNVKIGKRVVIAAQTGFSGGVSVGDDAIIGGQVGVGDKAVIDSKAVVGSGSGILTGAHVRAGEPVWGTPARPLRGYLKGLAYVTKLEGFRQELKDLKRDLIQMKKEKA